MLSPHLTSQKVIEMVENSARVTHTAGNRRYKDYVFSVEGNVIRQIARYSSGIAEVRKPCEVCGGAKVLIFWDECPTCGGAGCQGGKLCVDGLVKQERPCPSCGKN